MAAETEIERLIVRLMGDNRQYKKMLNQSKQTTEVTMNAMGRAIEKQTGRFVKGQRSMQAALKRTSKVLKSTGKQMTAMGRSMSFRLTLPILAVGVAATKSFASFDDAMTKSTSIMQVTEQQIARMRDVTLELSSGGVLQGPKELAESYFFLASAGKSAEQSMALLPKVAAFATAGAFDMALATDLLTDAQSALGLSSKNVARDTENLVRLSDVLVKANTLANATVQQFSEALTNTAGATLKIYNKTVEEGVAVLAAYADQGVKAQVAGTNLSRITLLLSKAALKQAKAHERLGFDVFDATGKMRNYADIIQNLEDITRGMSDETRAATLVQLGFQARVQNAILPLIGSSKAIREYQRQLENAGGTTQDVANKQMKSFASQMKQVWNQIKVLFIGIGKQLSPVILKLGEIIKSLIKTWQGWGKDTQIMIGALLGVVAALGPLLISLGLLVSTVGFAIGGIVKLITGFKTLQTVMLLTTARANALRIALGGIVAIGFAAFFIGASNAIRKANEELEKSIELLGIFRDKRVESIIGSEALTAQEKFIALTREHTLRLKEHQDAIKNLAAARKKSTEFITVTRVVNGEERFGVNFNRFGQALGFDPFGIGVAEKELERAKASFKKLDANFMKEVQRIRESRSRAPQTAQNLLTGLFPTRKRSGVSTGISDETESVRKSTNDLIKSLRLESDTFGLNSRAVQIFALSLKNITPLQLQQLKFWDKIITEQEKAAKTARKVKTDFEALREEGKRLIETNLTPFEKLQKEIKRVTFLFDQGVLGKGRAGRFEKNRAIQALEKAFDDLQKKAEIKITVTGFDAAIAGSAEAANRIQAFRDLAFNKPPPQAFLPPPILPAPRLPPSRLPPSIPKDEQVKIAEFIKRIQKDLEFNKELKEKIIEFLFVPDKRLRESLLKFNQVPRLERETEALKEILEVARTGKSFQEIQKKAEQISDEFLKTNTRLFEKAKLEAERPQIPSVEDPSTTKQQDDTSKDTAKNTNSIAKTNKQIVNELKKSNKKQPLQAAGFTK